MVGRLAVSCTEGNLSVTGCEEPIITTFGHWGLNTSRSVLDTKVSPVCNGCNDNTPETVKYYVIKCPDHNQTRLNLKKYIP